MPDFTLRPMTPADSAALATLTEQSPDGGKITFSPRFHRPAYEVFVARGGGDMLGVVAEAEGAQGLAGAARVSFGECQYEGQLRPYALLSSLTVHPDYRLQGIAAALAKWRIEQALERNGAESLILADIQTGNVGSTANAKKWATHIGGQIVTVPVPMRAKPPRPLNGITVRAATADELGTIAANLNTFYKDYNFYRPETADHLATWLAASPFDTPINHYWVAVDRDNRLLAGMGIKEDGRLMSLYIENLPLMIRIANLALKIIPPDHEMRPLQAEKVWFAPGGLEAARYLWQTARWEWRDRGSSLLVNYDPRSPLRDMLQIPAWMPSTTINMAVRAPVPRSDAWLLDPFY